MPSSGSVSGVMLRSGVAMPRICHGDACQAMNWEASDAHLARAAPLTLGTAWWRPQLQIDWRGKQLRGGRMRRIIVCLAAAVCFLASTGADASSWHKVMAVDPYAD